MWSEDWRNREIRRWVQENWVDFESGETDCDKNVWKEVV